jgi:hypothetical protein
MLLDPSHAMPAGHGLHDVWVVVVPPLVCDPTAHTLHVLAAVPLNLLSDPQSEHTPLDPTENLPGTHLLCTLDPSHLYPPGQLEQEGRFSAVFPCV